ncbi:hypothetical protein H6F93_04965 [Leptolyngbya sp. FACHB-671]|uniref:hypothetical protein n=1 Tax=Leptolyngbya sp. FACHB-671 TaxID=2692812 RepID=UPI001681D02B|nr:hypothetical protein [Leptolyngbya sp. FACHB-671]MBD2066886.1 hypothetical protein [Leptolyngbya sp. FACHB-671]
MEKDQIHNQTANPAVGQLVLPAAGQSKSDFALLMRALCRHPFLLWGSLWTILLITVQVTLNSFLLNPEFVTQSEQIQEPAAIESPATPASPSVSPSVEDKDSLPLWSFGAIAFSCAIASLMVSQRLRQPPNSRKPKRASVSPRILAQNGAISQSRPTAPALKPSTLRTESEEPGVSVVPTEESHPLDWGEENLADNLDIRYRRPLSFWR